jgi:hypothetical protein
MEAVLVGILGYLLWHEWKAQSKEETAATPSKRLCDYYVAGSVFEDPSAALARGVRLLEFHIYADEQGHPIVAKTPLNEGYDYAADNMSFESCCVTCVNEAFPSESPLILSLVFHSENAVTMNRAAEHLRTTIRKHLLEPGTTDIVREPAGRFTNKVIIVSGGNTVGTEMEPLVNVSWSESDLRRLTYSQAIHSRDQSDLVAYNRDHITMVAPDPLFGKSSVNPDTALAYGCQWNLFANDRVQTGFVEKPSGLQ